MLEVYTYHKIKETDGFDDIRSSFEIEWEKNFAKNEFDCILTKGFSSLFIECKATKAIKDDFYNKISVLADNLGINATVVLIADTNDTVYNNKRIEHGKQLKKKVITISDRDDIKNIGNVLLDLLNK